eukprot:12891448-Prorocentrum_lima.AAC.1
MAAKAPDTAGAIGPTLNTSAKGKPASKAMEWLAAEAPGPAWVSGPTRNTTAWRRSEVRERTYRLHAPE